MTKKKSGWLEEKLNAQLDDWAPWTAVRIEIFGEELLIVENHKGILVYGETEMRISCGRRVLRITGLGLTLQAMTENTMAIRGQILGVEYLD